MLTRRMFHTRLIAALALTAAPPLARAATGAAATDDLWLNRLTFGASVASRAEIAAMGREAWLDDQLQRPASDAAIEARLAAARLHIAFEAGQDGDYSWEAVDEMRPLSLLSADAATLIEIAHPQDRVRLHVEHIRPTEEVVNASLIRAVHAGAQLREVMTQFWHDHFNVDANRSVHIAAMMGLYDATMREHALGNFRTLLGEVARAPAMLYFLDNHVSQASPANENFARELMELHTLGIDSYLNDRYRVWSDVPGAGEGRAEGYLDLDVYEVARAFTGWSVGDGREISSGVHAPFDGQVNYVASWHDPYQKRVLGREFPPNRGPREDGEEVLDILSSHPGTARHVCRKIARRLLSDDPDPALVNRLAEVFLAAREAPDQIAQVVRALVLSREFDAPPTKLRRPFELLAGLYRATGAEVHAPRNRFGWLMYRAGWRQHRYPLPTGHSDMRRAWTGASTLNRMVDLVLAAHDDGFETTSTDIGAVEAGETVEAFLARRIAGFEPGRAAEALREAAEITGADLTAPAADIGEGDRRGLATAAIALAALGPEFLQR